MSSRRCHHMGPEPHKERQMERKKMREEERLSQLGWSWEQKPKKKKQGQRNAAVVKMLKQNPFGGPKEYKYQVNK